MSDFAKHIGLSAWTVSRAINGHPEVNPQTRQRIMVAMGAVGFRPNPFARGLGGRRTGVIGVCAIGLDRPHLVSQIFHLQEYFLERRLRILLEITIGESERELRILDDFARMHVDGIVTMHSTLDGNVAAKQVQGRPCVHIDPQRPQKQPSIALDVGRAMRELFDHLRRLGHTSFALLCASDDRWRRDGLAAAARAHGLDPNKCFRVLEKPDVESAIEAGQLMTETIVKWSRLPTAIIAADDRMALGVLQALQRARVDVPREISVTGFGSLDIARKLHPTLTTIDYNPMQFMHRAGEMLLEQIAFAPRKRSRSMAEKIAPELITGESTGPACHNEWTGK